MRYRPYASDDRPACLAIYDSNAERFFAPGDREVFIAFLERKQGFFGVLCDESGAVAGCGGIGTHQDGKLAVLTWGMIHAQRHGQGLGRALALARLRKLSDMTEVEKVILNTSNRTVGFYLKLGFRVARFVPNGYREGLDRYDLEMVVDEEMRRQFGAA
ncbi:MAG TPA: GNAT family N-acetyltransferase [Gemmataceae bacterium]|nr:GNAT family N-acetyltransferase [Gemmataceae bacterium]